MLPRVQPYQNTAGGDTNSGLFEDIGTRSLLTVRVGESAGKISSGTANTFVGYESGKVNTGGSFDTFVGYQAGAQNTNANYSTFIGAFAGRENQRGSECVFIGYRSGELNRDGQSVVAVGSYAMRENVSGTGSVAIGWRAAERNLDGDYNTFVGAECAQDNRSGNMNTMCGFRSGRANFEGSENTYIGAFSGYSNRSGSANCLVGYKSGQNMEFGNCNVAIGAYTFEQGRHVSSSVAIGPFAGANASSGADSVYIGARAAENNTDGSQNVMIGVNSGRNNTRDRNVIIGYNAGEQCSSKQSVIIGANAALNMIADNSVIIGYGTASNLYGGMSNVFVGTGAAPYTSNVSHGISIGTKNTFTSSHSITVGETIYNERAYSILMGFDLQSDADNSVVMGNTVKVQSVIFFKDPLNYFIQESVLNDASIKLGISNITYGCNASMLYWPEQNVIYTNAFAGVLTSNVANSTTNRPSSSIQTSNTDLVRGLPMSYNAVVASGHAFAISNQAFLQTNDLQNVFLSDYVQSSWSLSNVAAMGWRPADLLRRHSCNIQMPLTNVPNTTIIRNIRDFQTSPASPLDVQFWFPKRVQRPVLPFSIASPLVIQITNHVLTSTEAWQNLMVVSNISYTTDGIVVPGAQTRMIIEQPPSHITIDKGAYDIGETVRFKVHKDRIYAISDTIRVSVLTEITDDTGRIFGIPGSQGDIRIEFVPSTQLTLYRPTFLNPSSPVTLTSNHIHGIPPIPSNTPLNITALDENCTLYLQNGTYPVTSNIIQQLVDEDAYGQYADSQYVTNVASLSNYITTAFDKFSYAYTEAITPSVVSFLNLSDQFISYYPDILDFTTASNAASQIPLYYASFPALYETMSNAIDRIQLQDEVFQVDKSTIFEYSSNIFEQYDAFPWQSAGNLHSNISNDIRDISYPQSSTYVHTIIQNTSNLSNTYPLQSLDSASNEMWASNIDLLQSSLQLLYYKYFEIPRFPQLTYSNIQTGSISFQMNAPINTNTVATFNIPSRSSVFSIGSQFAYDTKLQNAPTISTSQVLPGQLAATPVIADTDLVVKTHPRHGILYETEYVPFDPFVSQDKVEYVARSNTTFTEDVTWNIQFNHTNYFVCLSNIGCSTYNYGRTNSSQSLNIPTADVFICNVQPIYDRFTSNTVVYVDGAEVSREQPDPVYVLRPDYVAATGYLTEHVDTSVIYATSSTEQVNDSEGVTTYDITVIRSTRTFDVSSNTVDSTYTLSNFGQTLSNQTNISSNITVSCNIDTTYRWNTAYNIRTNQIASYSNIWNYYASHDPTMFVYSSNSIDPLPTESYVDFETAQIPTQTPFTSNIYVRHVNLTQHTVYQPFYTLNRNVIFASNATFTTSGVIRVGQGFVSTCTQDQIDNGHIVAPLLTARTIPFTRGQTTKQLTLDVYNSNEYMTEVVPTITATCTLNGTPYTNLASVLHTASNGITLSFDPEYIHVLSAARGWLHNGVRIPYADIDGSTNWYTSTSNYTSDTISFFYSSNVYYTSPVVATVIFTRLPYHTLYSVNTGVSTYDTTVLDYNSFNIEYGSSNIIVASVFPPAVAELSHPISFTTDDVREGRVRVTFPYGLLFPVTFTYLIENAPYTFTVQPYVHNAFPAVTKVPNQTLTIRQLGTEASVSNVINTTPGTLWNMLSNSYVQNEHIHPSNIHIHIQNEDSMRAGYFWKNGREIAWSCTLHDVLSNTIRYVPYDPTPNATSNVALQIRCRYGETMSPLYTIQVKNYISRFPALARCTTYRAPSLLNINDVIQRTAGMVQDGLSWSPSTLTLNAMTAAPVLQLSNGYAATWPITFTASSDPVDFNTTASAITIHVDQADSFSLCNVAISNLAPFAPARIEGIQFYVLQPPSHGWIQRRSTGASATTFTDEQANANEIIYQHDGTEEFTDQFTIGVSSSVYNLSLQTITIQVNIRPLPLIQFNKPTYLYFDTQAAALTTFNLFQSNISIQSRTSDASSYIHIRDTQWIHTYDTVQNRAVNEFTVAAFTSNNIRYIINSPAVFQTAPYDTLSLQLYVNSVATPGYSNSLIDVHPVYKDKFVTTFEAYINKYQSSNILLTETQNRHSVLQYDFNPNLQGYSNLSNRAFTYGIQVKMIQDLIASEFPAASDAVAGIGFLQRYSFEVRFIDVDETPFVNMHFTHEGVYVQFPGQVVATFIPFHPLYTPAFDQWNNIVFVNEDLDNNQCASLYIRYDNTQTRQLNSIRNILKGANIPAVDVSRLSKIQFRVDTQHPFNYRGAKFTSNIVATNTSLGRYYDLDHYATQFEIRNQEMFTSTYLMSEVGSGINQYVENVHNIVVGKEIYVRGANNICIGNTFNTSGQYSIIIGTDIGSKIDEVQLNELYQCIIIGNKSFQNSLTRDMISIGNNNYNSLNTYPVAIVNNFLSQKPIIIGNDISEDAIEYNVNIGNTFCKSINGGNQIYLGRYEETVCIGYTSNMRFSHQNNLKLRVSGNITADTYMTSYTAASNVAISIHSPVSFDPVTLHVHPCSTYRAKHAIGVATHVESYNVFVQHRGVCKMYVYTPVAQGDLLYIRDIGGLEPQTDDTIRSYTIAKALQSVSSTVGAQLISCLLLV